MRHAAPIRPAMVQAIAKGTDLSGGLTTSGGKQRRDEALEGALLRICDEIRLAAAPPICGEYHRGAQVIDMTARHGLRASRDPLP